MLSPTPLTESTPSTQYVSDKPLIDTQAGADHRNIAIDRVGVKNVRYPIQLKMQDGSLQSTVAEFEMYVSLPAEERGTHMSRFVSVLNESDRVIDPASFQDLCESIQERLNAPAASISMECPFFLTKQAPVTGIESMMDYKLFLSASTEKGQESTMGVEVHGKSLCPCSKQISDYGAHNQRSKLTATVKTNAPLHVEELIGLVEQAASSPLWSLLKRQDERHVTQLAYDNPKFVEDIVRDLAVALNEEDRVTWYSVSSENFESIHNHEAFASIERTKS